MSKEQSYSVENNEGLRLNNTHHLFLMILPNLLHPRKLARNVRHPIFEVLHKGQRQQPIEAGKDRYIVEHTLFGKLVTVDIVDRDVFPEGLLARARQLFREDFYYGHNEYFTQAFRLCDRTYVTGEIFNYEEHINRFRKQSE